MKSGDSFVLEDNLNIRLIARAYKISKSRANVVNPDDVVFEYGADFLCLYEMFVGSLRDSKSWNIGGIEGVHRFLGRVWRLIVGSPLPDVTFRDGTVASDDKCIDKWDKLPRSAIEPFVLLLSPYALHMVEELWFRLGHSNSLAQEPF